MYQTLFCFFGKCIYAIIERKTILKNNNKHNDLIVHIDDVNFSYTYI